jgi:alpha-beta hydrolase superfamily lysophospholipase
MTAEPETEIPFHFGAGSELFGLYHPAAAAPISRRAVVLCPPFGQDMIRCHRLYRQLAQALAGAGLPVLRFDYYGSGDSAGASGEFDWDRCIGDTVAAADELRARSGCAEVIAFGARLGANIASVSATRARFAGLVLWDPVFDGASYVARLDAMQAALPHDTNRFLKARPAVDVANQWLGFAVSDSLRRQVLKQHLEPSMVPTLLLDSIDPPEPRDAWSAPGQSVQTRRLPATPWEDPERLELAILSHELIQAVNSHLRGTR